MNLTVEINVSISVIDAMESKIVTMEEMKITVVSKLSTLRPTAEYMHLVMLY